LTFGNDFASIGEILTAGLMRRLQYRGIEWRKPADPDVGGLFLVIRPIFTKL